MPNPVVPEKVSTLASQLAEPRLMRRGSVSERYVKCNKAGCPCGEHTHARHRPYYSVSRVVKGRTLVACWVSPFRLGDHHSSRLGSKLAISRGMVQR